ncbi:unnamed protein product [Paramecium octaurelia]|uniref:Uncharacterized protein n=1 Tax=Paramecium octaurelia TaxID=43137 RepID=A0A8S1Y0V4_PAROT|nr:unnamed protein product [Paramecium octaurelia]
MEANKNYIEWLQLRIKNRFEQTKKPETKILSFQSLGQQPVKQVKIQDNWGMVQIRLNVSQLHYSKFTVLVNNLNALTARSQLYQNFPLLNVLLNHKTLPMTLSNFESQQKQHNAQGGQTLCNGGVLQLETSKISQERNIDSIILRLRIIWRVNCKIAYSNRLYVYQFYQRECCLLNLLVMGGYYQKVYYSKGRRAVKNQRLSIIDFKSLSESQNDQKNKQQDTPSFEEDLNSAIYLSPNFLAIQQSLLKPLDLLLESANSVNRLEKELIPLVDIDQKKINQGKIRAYKMKMTRIKCGLSGPRKKYQYTSKLFIRNKMKYYKNSESLVFYQKSQFQVYQKVCLRCVQKTYHNKGYLILLMLNFKSKGNDECLQYKAYAWMKRMNNFFQLELEQQKRIWYLRPMNLSHP